MKISSSYSKPILMKYIYIIFAFYIVSLFESCDKSTKMSEQNTVFDTSQMDTIICAKEYNTSLDSIIAKIEYVKLQSMENFPVGEIDNLLITPEHIIVADYNLAKSIFIFDRQGMIQTVICRHGRGPQEYLSIFDVVLTPDQKRIAVLDNYGKKILYFDLAGNFLFHKDTPFYPIFFKYLDDENMLMVTYGLGADDPGLVSYPYNNDLLYCVDTTMQIKKSFMPNQFSKEFGASCTPKVKQFNNNQVFASHIYSDTIYQVTPERMIPKYWIDLSPVDGIANFWKEMTPEKHETILNEIFFNGDFLENDHFAIFRPFGDIPNILFSKETKKCYYLGKSSSSVFGIYVGSVRFAYKDQFITVVPAFELCGGPKIRNADQKYQKLEEEIKTGLTENDDPVLLFYTLKDPE